MSTQGIDRLAFRTKLARMISYASYVRHAHELGHEKVSTGDIAADFSITPQEVEAELNSLATCGFSRNPMDLVEINYDYSNIQFTDAQGLDRAVPLTQFEAETLLLLLDLIEDTPGVLPLADVRSARHKLAGLTGRAQPQSSAVASSDDDEAIRRILRKAKKLNKRIAFTYFSRNDNKVTQRKVSPISLFEHDGEFYLTAFDHKATDTATHPELTGVEKNAQTVANPGAVRTFNVSGMREVKLVDLTANVPKRVMDAEKAGHPFTFSSAPRHATVLVAPDSGWILNEVETMTVTGSQPGPDGREWTVATLPLVSEEWLIRFTLARGGRLVVTQPSDVAEAIAARARTALQAYQEGS